LKDHLINEFNQVSKCPYCNNNLKNNNWNSSFNINKHYKNTICAKCSKEIRIKVNFAGSGHDCFDSNSNFCKLIKDNKGKSVLEEKVK
jgi:superfamily II helicase